MKLLFYDVETTGTDHWRHCIHQLSAIAVIDGERKGEINLNIKPHEKAVIDGDALKVCGVNPETIEGYPHRTEQFLTFIAFLKQHIDPFNPSDKFFLVGYNNAGFDDKFLRNLFLLQNDGGFGSYFFNNSIDVMSLASYYLMPDRHRMPSFKLKRVAIWLGIEVDETRLHDALYDVELTIQIYNAVKGKTIDDF